MTRYHFFILLTIFLQSVTPSLADEHVPLEINGFRLGTSIEKYDYISYRNFLKEVIFEDMGGFRKAEIAYGVCRRPGEIIRIKMKYRNPSQKFYKKLLKSYKEKFGKPEEFVGDAFGIIMAWKWRFTDKDNNNITLVLQHNLKNLDENVGNMVKLSMPDRIEEERECFNKSFKNKKMDYPDAMLSRDWENMLPH